MSVTRGTHGLYRLPYTPRVPRAYLWRLESNLEAVMGLSTWHMCLKQGVWKSISNMPQFNQDMYFRPERDKSSTRIWSRRTLINRLTHTPHVTRMCLGCFWSSEVHFPRYHTGIAPFCFWEWYGKVVCESGIDCLILLGVGPTLIHAIQYP